MLSRISPLLATCLLAVTLSAAPAPAQAETLIKLGHDQPEDSTHHQAALRWKELVEERTDGEVKVQIFPSRLLGSGTQMIEQAQAGAIEAVVLPTGWAAPFAPSVSVLDLPFLFPSRETTYEVVDGPVGKKILEPLEEKNLVGVAFWESGFKQFTGTFPIKTPEDYQGHKIRTMPSAVIQEQFKAFGATPTTIDFGELYTALQQGVVDGQENPIATIAAMRFFEVQPNMTLSDHGFLAYIFMFNKNFLESQPEEVREVLVNAAQEAAEYQREIIQEAEKKHLEAFREAGVEIYELSEEQRAAFEKASTPVYEWFAEEYGGETLQMVRDAVDEIEKAK
ncbi:TRAP transporter substrate-binding protein [Afifella pfennigii]|uniref:TRAP transporter substrate-binding protein n=1 Tax=Afifella pfennigii TaxID=209897 RepID=UPI000479FDCA|nr:TRAP transporter substrate-binding protein [Afifella pfennigii]